MSAFHSVNLISSETEGTFVKTVCLSVMLVPMTPAVIVVLMVTSSSKKAVLKFVGLANSEMLKLKVFLVSAALKAAMLATL
jgi:hypothetical protein